jgi:hypothetical protein
VQEAEDCLAAAEAECTRQAAAAEAARHVQQLEHVQREMPALGTLVEVSYLRENEDCSSWVWELGRVSFIHGSAAGAGVCTARPQDLAVRGPVDEMADSAAAPPTEAEASSHSVEVAPPVRALRLSPPPNRLQPLRVSQAVDRKAVRAAKMFFRVKYPPEHWSKAPANRWVEVSYSYSYSYSYRASLSVGQDALCNAA